MSGPYFYKIKHKLTGKYYVGSQYGKTANKENFFASYFTSSQTIKNIILNEGIEIFKICVMIERKDAREYENYYLRRCYRLLGKDKFLKIFYNRNLAPGILLDDDIITKQTLTRKLKWNSGLITKPVPPNWKGKQRSNAMRKKLSNSKKGHEVTNDTRKKLREANLGKVQSHATKEKRAKSLKLNPNAYNKKHWLFVSPNKKYYYTIGKRNQRLHELGLSEGPGFLNYVNTNKSPTHGKNIGWLFFEGKEKIEDLLKNIKKEDICYYE